MVIPAQSEVYGVLAEVKRPGRSRGRGQALLHLERLVLPNRYDVTLDARLTGIETRAGVTVDDRGYLRGPSGRRKDAAEVTSTAGYSAMVGFGATFGHPKGALYGAAMGGGLALLAVKAARGPELEVPAGSTIEVVLERPLELATALLPPTGARP